MTDGKDVSTLQRVVPSGVLDAAAQRDRGRLWTTASWLLLAALIAVSVFVGYSWRSDVHRDRAAVFKTTASAVASSVVTSLLRTLTGGRHGVATVDLERFRLIGHDVSREL